MKPLAGAHNWLKTALNGLKKRTILHSARTRPMWQVSLAALEYNIWVFILLSIVALRHSRWWPRLTTQMLKDCQTFRENPLVRVCRRQMHTDLCFSLNDSCACFQKFQANSVKGRRSHAGSLEHVGSETVQQNISCWMQKQPELIGQKTVTGGTVAFRVSLVIFYI